MKHQYKTESLWKKTFQSVIDFFVDIYSHFLVNRNTLVHSDPKKILIITLAQLGDVLAVSYVFPLIRERYPDSVIDVLIGEWCKPVLKNNPYIRNIFCFNHFRMNRAEKSLLKKYLIHIKTLRLVRKTLREERYDLSIEGGVTHPNGNILSYRAKVKRRIGFGSGGFGSLLTDEILFPERSGFHILEAVLEELKKIDINKKLGDIKPYFVGSKIGDQKRHPFESYFESSFIIVHPESGNTKRFVCKEFWLQIVQRILEHNKYKVIICGTSNRSNELINFMETHISNANKSLINAVQKLSLDDFYLLAEHAKAAITLESFPAHICAISCETLSFYKNGSGSFFFPIPNKGVVVIHNHSPSKDIHIHAALKNYYVEKIESAETIKLFEEFLIKLKK